MTTSTVLTAVMMTIMIFFLIINSFQALLLMFSVPELWSHWQLADDQYFHALVGSESLPPVSVVSVLTSPEGSVEFARMLLELNYPRFEVILVVDGENRDGLRELANEFELYEVPSAFTVNVKTRPIRAYYRSRTNPRLLCLDKTAGPGGDAINAALNAARYPHAMFASQAVSFESDALLRLARPLLLDRTVVCVGGVLRPNNFVASNDGRNRRTALAGWTVGCQTVEYLRNYMFQRLGWNGVASNIVYASGTVLFRREDIFGIGGFDPDSEESGIDVSVRLHRYLTDMGINARMPVISDPVAWSALPTKLADVGAARKRWILRLRESLSSNVAMLLNPEYGAFGMIVMPYLWLGVIIAALLELVGYAGLVVGLLTGVLDASFTWAYLASVLGYGILLSVWSVVFQAVSFKRADQTGGTGRLLAFAVIEALGYRQVMAFYRTAGFFAERQPKNLNG
ncbi:MAG: glycosyltransferase family 2 protein [Gemmatimonadaceae bacterium]